MDETGKENAGFSLLTTENPLTVDNDDQEDAEAEEEQRRRQQELQNMMAYAFDDIGDEENSTINSSFDVSTSGHVLTSGLTGYEESSRQTSEINLDDQYLNAQFNSTEPLQVLYQVQDRELKRLHAELNGLRGEKEKEITGLKRKMLLIENEHNGTNISLKQCQDLLVEKKRDIDDHLNEINNLKDTIDNITLAKRNSDEEAQLWKSKYMEIEQKMNLIDQGIYVPVPERQIRNKYEQEISDLQQSLEQSQKNLENAIKAKSIAENEMKELKQSHEFLAMEKEEQVHTLYSQLENSKFQCHNLTDRIGSLEKEYQNLTNMLNNTTKEQDLPYTGSTKILQQELKRSLDDQKLKRDEIIKLEKQIEEQNNIEVELRKKINDVDAKYNKILNDNQIIQKEKETLTEKINELTTNIDELTTKLEQTFKVKLENLEIECRKVKTENKDLIQKLEDMKRENIEQNARRQTQIESRRSSYDTVKINSEIEMLKMQNEQLYKQLEDTNKVNKDIELQSLKKIQELQTEMKPTASDKKVQIIEEQYQLLKNQNAKLQKQVNDAEVNSELYKNQSEKYEKLCLEIQETCVEQKSNLHECHSKISELEGQMILKNKRDDLLEDLQQKALMFERYMKNKSDVSMHNKSVNTDESEHSKDIIQKNDLEKIIKVHHEKYIELSNENKTLKEKIMFDRTALNELTEVWHKEMNRLNSLVKELKREIGSKNMTIEKRQQTVDEEIEQMRILINKLTEALRHKDKFLKEAHDRELNLKRQQEEINQKIRTDYERNESRILSQFEKNMEEMKTKFYNEEEHMAIKIENIQKKCTTGLEEIEEKISTQKKYNSEKYALETKVIEAYYDLLIQQAKIRKK